MDRSQWNCSLLFLLDYFQEYESNVCYFVDFLPTIKLPKLKKLRQWSHDSILNLSNMTTSSRTPNTLSRAPRASSYDDNQNGSPIKPTHISTISSVAIDARTPSRDNLGLYALKADRNSAKRGILLTLPKRLSITRSQEANVYLQDQNHEVFEPCDKSDEELRERHSRSPYGGKSEVTFDSSTKFDNISDKSNIKGKGQMYSNCPDSSSSDNRSKIQPPPRKKKRASATKVLCSHKSAGKKVPIQVHEVKQVERMFRDAPGKNSSELYRIVRTTGEIVEQEGRKNEHFISIGPPAVHTAVAVKLDNEKKFMKAFPVQKQLDKVKNVDRFRPDSPQDKPKKIYQQKYTESLPSEESVDIFKINKNLNQQKLFDEFDELFEKSAKQQLSSSRSNSGEMTCSSSSLSGQSSVEEITTVANIERQAAPPLIQVKSLKSQNHEEKKKEIQGVLDQRFKNQGFQGTQEQNRDQNFRKAPDNRSRNVDLREQPMKVQDLENKSKSEEFQEQKQRIQDSLKLPANHLQQDTTSSDSSMDSNFNKPTIVYERPKQTKKILYYNDEADLAGELKILQANHNANLANIALNGNCNAVLPSNSNSFDINSHIEDKVPINDRINNNCTGAGREETLDGNLRIFSNEGIFVFNL